MLIELTREGIMISMDGREEVFDNILVERLCRNVKHEEVYLRGCATMGELMVGLTDYFAEYNSEPPQQSHGQAAGTRRSNRYRWRSDDRRYIEHGGGIPVALRSTGFLPPPQPHPKQQHKAKLRKNRGSAVQLLLMKSGGQPERTRFLS
ncbi:MAG: hypothetical protein JNL91_08595 [Candidatus Accumulibacter sp.]|nr:hypothetical protein [Accumulibacter sp.]